VFGLEVFTHFFDYFFSRFRIIRTKSFCAGLSKLSWPFLFYCSTASAFPLNL
jgi:hypothetical protein